MKKPLVAITAGDPAGIGPEIVAAAVRHPDVLAVCRPLVVTGPKKKIPLGKPSKEAGQYAIDCLRQALALVDEGQVDAIATAPVSKESFHLADYGYPGHTEWLAKQCHAPTVGMLMAAGPMRALLLTRHVPIAKVASALTAKTIEEGAALAHTFVRKVLGRSKPRMAMCGLNPHAGDNGLIGREEVNVVRPALMRLRRRGIAVQGPIASDALFRDMAKGHYDLALAAYHDQGMIPLKLFAGDKLVNITLGLPFIRTSPGHGTAYDISGKRKANPSAMIEAICLAAAYASRV